MNHRTRQIFSPRLIVLKLIFILISLFVTFSAHAEDSIVKSEEEFVFDQSPNFVAEEPYTPVAHFKNSTYVIWVDPKYRPWVTQITNGSAKTVPLDTGADYYAQEDGHHRFSLGVDKAGFIHVTGDMHNYGNTTTSVVHPYPVRYQKKIILYWRSNQPEDVSGGFGFKGDSDATASYDRKLCMRGN
jgi:hypothetical protein